MRSSLSRLGTAIVAGLVAGAIGLTAAGTTAPATASTSKVRVLAAQEWTLDATFGDGGIVLTDFPYGKDRFSEGLSSVIQPTREILVGGATFNSQPQREMASIVRYLPNGDLDRSFGDGGRVIIGPHTSYAVTELALQPVEHQIKIVLGVETTFFNPLRGGAPSSGSIRTEASTPTTTRTPRSSSAMRGSR